MTQKAFNKEVSRLLRDFENRMRAALGRAGPNDRDARKRVRQLKTEWKETYGTYYVGEYTVKHHFRKIPKRRARA